MACSYCHGPGHNTRSCPDLLAGLFAPPPTPAELSEPVRCADCGDLHPIAFSWRGLTRRWHQRLPSAPLHP